MSTIKKDQLLNALEIVKPALANRDMIEQATSFAFAGGFVITYNDEISIRHPVSLPISGAVKADELHKFLTKAKTAEIEIEMDGGEVKIKAGKASASFRMDEEMKLPLDEIHESGDWEDVPQGLLQAMDFCSYSCSVDMSKPILTCVNIRQDGFIEASNNYRIIRYQVGKLETQAFLIPAKIVKVLSSSKYKIEKIKGGEGWRHFQCSGGTIISCRVFNDEFPPVDFLFQAEGTQIEFPSKIAEILEKAMVFSKRDHLLDEEVLLSFSGRKVKISSNNDYARFEEESNSRYRGKDFAFLVNPHLLIGIVKTMQSCTLTDSTIQFNGEGWQQLIAIAIPE